MTAQDRIESLDLLRGVAVLGILLLNIVSFAMPDAAYFNPRAYGGAMGADLAVFLVNFVLFDGKMRGLFALLFGASMLLVADRAQAAGDNPASVHYRRMAWLLLFGLAHLWLVWDGDILAHYALVGMIAFTLRDLPIARQVTLAVMLLALATFFYTAFPVQVLTANGGDTPEHARALRNLSLTFGTPDPAQIARELALYRSDYPAILTERFRTDGDTPINALTLLGPETLAYMLLGMAGLRSGMLGGTWSRARYRRWLAWCWGLALPATLLLAALMLASGFSLLSVTIVDAATAPVRPLMTLGWVELILLAVPPASGLGIRLAAAGRMAFTNYLLTSLICTELFYGYGLGWFGHLSRWQLYPLVLVIWATILLWSRPWLDRYRFGPLEWLWRSLARARHQPMRRTDMR